MTFLDADNMSDADLRWILLTVDGKGAADKHIALNVLLERKYNEGFLAGEAEERGDDA